MNIAIVLALCSMTALGAADPAGHLVFTIDIDPSSYPVLDTFGNPTLFGTQFSHRGAGGATWDDHRRIEIPIDQEDVAADTFTAYVYRRGCRVDYYHIDSLKNDSLHRSFHCEPAPEKTITVRIESSEGLTTDDLFAWVSYTSPRGHKMPDETFRYQDVDFSVGVFPIASDGTFTLPMPDFGNDPVLLKTTPTSLEDNPGQFESRFDIVVARLHGGVFGRLVANAKQEAALPVARDYPMKLALTFVAQR